MRGQVGISIGFSGSAAGLSMRMEPTRLASSGKWMTNGKEEWHDTTRMIYDDHTISSTMTWRMNYDIVWFCIYLDILYLRTCWSIDQSAWANQVMIAIDDMVIIKICVTTFMYSLYRSGNLPFRLICLRLLYASGLWNLTMWLDLNDRCFQLAIVSDVFNQNYVVSEGGYP